MTARHATGGLVLAGLALNGAALTVGSMQGAAWISRPLDVSVSVQMESESGSGPVPLCAGAEVFYADTRQDAGNVQVLQEATEQADTVKLRVLSTAIVNEPVVTVNLRVGCEQKFARSYVLLADLPGLPDAAGPSLSSHAAPALTATNPIEAGVFGTATPPRQPAARRRAASAVPSTVRQSARIAAAPSSKASGSRASRLKLEPLEVLTERIKTLESAAAAVPREGMAKDSERVQQLQQDVQTLLTQAARNNANLAAMRDRLEKAETQRASNELAYALAALALLCAVAMVWIWSRRRDPFGWNSQPVSSHYENTGGDTIAAGALKAVKPAPAPAAPVIPKQGAPLDVNLIEMDEWDWPKNGMGRRESR
jgi:hypothetical protein